VGDGGGGWGPGSAPREAIVDLGCGPGNISFRLARALPQARVLGLDGAATMVSLAQERRQRHPGEWPQLRFEQLRLPLPGAALPGLDPVAALGGPFGAVVSNSLLHHLHDPMVLWQAVGQLAAPGATVYIKDLRRPGSAVEADAVTQRYAAGAPAVLRRDFRASLAAAFTATEVEAQLVQASQLGSAAGTKGEAWSGFTVAEVDDRYLEIHGRWLG
jgi:SAM-dependent methyltransferase